MLKYANIKVYNYLLALYLGVNNASICKCEENFFGYRKNVHDA